MIMNLKRTFFSGMLIIAVSVSSFSPWGTTRAFAQDNRSGSWQVGRMEVSPVAPAALPPGTTLLPANLVNLIDTSNAVWDPSAPDPSGVDYWPLTGGLLIVDSEVDEMPDYFVGENVYLSTTSGTLVDTCSTTSFTSEPTGVAINPNNDHIFISTDTNDRIFEISLGVDGIYCTADDSVSVTNILTLYGINDAEDVAYGNNTIFIAGGVDAEVYILPLGANGVLGGGDDGALAQFDTAVLGFHDLEGIGYNEDSDTLFIVSTQGDENYLGETTLSGVLLRAYDLSFMGTARNWRSDVSYAPGSQNPSIKNIYIASRALDNDFHPNENDGKIWEIKITPPTVRSITRIDPNPTPAASVRFKVTFSEAVTGVDSGDFVLTTQGLAGASISNVGGSGSTRTVTVNTGSGIGAIHLDAGDNDSIVDSYGNPLGGLGAGNGSYTAGDTYDIVPNTEIHIAGTKYGSYRIATQGSIRQSFAGANSGPVKVVNTTSDPMMAAERVIYKVNNIPTSFSEMMALPNNQLDTTYWLPWYNNVELDTQLRFANVSSLAATVSVFIGGTEMPGSPFSLASGTSTRKSFAGVNGGPVQIVSDQNVVVAERVIYKAVGGTNTSFSEMMALSNSQLDSIYWLPWYNNVELDTQLRFANVSNQPTAVHVFIGNQEMPGSPFTLAPGASVRKSFAGIDRGPVKIQSNQNIVAAERVIYKVNGVNTSFSELMALPNDQLDMTYWLPWYNNVELETQLRFGNVSNSTASVHVYIGGVEMPGSPFTLAPGASIRRSFSGINRGPVKIESNASIVAAERVIYKTAGGVNTSFSEMMGLPSNLLDATYWLPWYNNVELDTQLRFGVP